MITYNTETGRLKLKGVATYLMLFRAKAFLTKNSRTPTMSLYRIDGTMSTKVGSF